MKDEGELLQEMLGILGPDNAFKLGQLMGIMGKGDQETIRRLQSGNRILADQVKALQDEQRRLEEQIAEGGSD